MKMPGQTTIRRASSSLLVLLWVSTIVVALGWVLGWDLPFDPEPVTVVLGLISTAVTAAITSLMSLLQERQKELEVERISTSYALAYGYVNNFVEPVVKKLLSKTKPGGKKPEFFIYVPEKLSELYPSSIEGTLAKIREKNYSTEVVKLEFAEGRARDVMAVLREQGSRVRYFDFPHTLLTLTKMIDYQVEWGNGTFDEQGKPALGKKYIDQFRAEVQEMLEQKGISDYVRFTDKNLRVLEQE
jgi:hypothetical protein